MRKFLAALMAVLMIMAVVAVLPIGAETAPVKSTFDGTTPADANALPLVVTEVMTNTTASVYETADAKYSYDAFQYIEVYNRGSEQINLYDLAIVRSRNALSTDPWETNKKFLEASDGKGVKMSLNPGSIYQGITGISGATPEAVNQPGTCFIQPGEFAIIWFWTSKTSTACTDSGVSLGKVTDTADGQVYHKGFRDHYRTQNSDVTISDDLPIVAVCAMGQASATDTTARFSLNTSYNYTYALVWDEDGGRQFDPNADAAVTKQGSGDSAIYNFDSDIVCLWQWGTLTNASIPNGGVEGKATIYVPANSTPDRFNRQQLNDMGLTEIIERIAKVDAGQTTDADGNPITVTQEERDSVKAEALAKILKTDYVDADLAYGYKEVAIMAFEEAPTIGAMPAYQWAYVDPSRAPDSVKGTDENWAATAINTYITTALPTPDKDVANEEEKRDVVLKDRSELGNQGINKKDPTVVEENGFPIWALILIIAGGAVLLAAVAVVVIVILKKKNKPVALDDVAAEGEIEIIDETADSTNENTEE